MSKVLFHARDPRGFAAGVAERSLLAALKAGCHAPVGALAVVDDGMLTLRCSILALDGSEEVAGSVTGPPERAEALGAELAADLVARGAGPLLSDR